jgi:hypothetical protein
MKECSTNDDLSIGLKDNGLDRTIWPSPPMKVNGVEGGVDCTVLRECAAADQKQQG